MDNDTLCYAMTFLPSILQVKYRMLNKCVNEYVLKFTYFDKYICSYPGRIYQIVEARYSFKSSIDGNFNDNGTVLNTIIIHGTGNFQIDVTRFNEFACYKCETLQSIIDKWFLYEPDYFIFRRASLECYKTEYGIYANACFIKKKFYKKCFIYK